MMSYETLAKLTAPATEIAIAKCLNRKVLSIHEGKDGAEVITKVQVLISNTDREEIQFHYIKARESIAVEAAMAVATLKFLNIFNVKVEPETTPQEAKNESSKESIKEEIKQESKPESKKASGKSKSKKEVVKAEPKAKKPAHIPYNRGIKDHISTLSSHLTSSYGEEWKIRPGVKEWAQGLVGKDFLDTEGNLVPTFIAEVESFFNAQA